LTREREGYYADFGAFQHMAQAFSEGFVYSGHYSVNRGRRHGNSSRGVPPAKFVVFAQNHDQIGNRMLGERLSYLVSFEALKLAASVVLLSPFVPLLFMGDEYGETAPFQYFVSHSDKDLIEAVRKGRREEFAAFKWSGEPPDPQSEETFKRSRLNHHLKKEPSHRTLLEYHKELIRLRKTLPALRSLSKEKMDVAGFKDERVLAVRRWNGHNEILAFFNFNDEEVSLIQSMPTGRWRKVLDSSDRRWMGAGTKVPDLMPSPARDALSLQPHMVLLFEKEIQN
jgi:maltooligosyltrehalose trehalohydrolase